MRRGSSSTRRWAWTSTPPTSTPSRNAPRAGSRAFSSPRCRCARSRPGPRSPDFIEAFTGSNRFVIDYLADEVLARQPPEVRDFLLRTAVLDRLTGPLCDAVTGQSAGTAMLADLDRANLFVVAAGHRTHLVPLPPPVRRRAARTPAHRGTRPGPAAAPAGQRLVRLTRFRCRRRPARAGRRGLPSGRLPDGGSAARASARATGQPAAHAGSARCHRPSSAAARS